MRFLFARTRTRRAGSHSQRLTISLGGTKSNRATDLPSSSQKLRERLFFSYEKGTVVTIAIRQRFGDRCGRRISFSYPSETDERIQKNHTHTHTQVIFIYIWCHTLASRVCSCDKRGWFNPKFSPYGSGVYVPGGMLDGSVLYII